MPLDAETPARVSVFIIASNQGVKTRDAIASVSQADEIIVAGSRSRRSGSAIVARLSAGRPYAKRYEHDAAWTLPLQRPLRRCNKQIEPT